MNIYSVLMIIGISIIIYSIGFRRGCSYSADCIQGNMDRIEKRKYTEHIAKLKIGENMKNETLTIKYKIKEEYQPELEEKLDVVLRGQGFKFASSGFSFINKERDITYEKQRRG